MEITDRAEHDPVADLYQVDAYMRWALLAAEEVVGKRGLSVVLRDVRRETGQRAYLLSLHRHAARKRPLAH